MIQQYDPLHIVDVVFHNLSPGKHADQVLVTNMISKCNVSKTVSKIFKQMLF